MKKFLAMIVLILLFATPAYALTEDGRTDHNGFVRALMVEGRGLGSLLSLPLEVPRTAVTEGRRNGWRAIFTYLPKLIAINLPARILSSGADIILYPFVVPFTDDISPWTDGFGLPTYAWQDWDATE